MDWLKKLLEKHGVAADTIEKVMGDTKDINYIPKERFDEVNNSVKELKKQIEERDKQLKELGEKSKGNEELTKQIKELQDANEKAKKEYEGKLLNMALDNAINKKLTESKAKHADLLAGKFDKSKLKLKDDGTVEGLEEQFKTISETYKDLFSPDVSGNEPNMTGGSSRGEEVTDLRSALASVYKNN